MAFGGHKHTEESFLVHIRLQDQLQKPLNLKLWTRETITSVPKSNNSTNPESWRPNQPSKVVNVDILIGIDYYWEVVILNSSQQLPCELVLSDTRFGPVLSGLQQELHFNYSVTQSSTNDGDVGDTTNKMDHIIRRFLESESVGTAEESDANNTEIMQQYYHTVKIIDGVIHVRFPWKTNHPHLPDNKALAMRRLENQYAKLHNDPQAWSDYCETFEQQLKSGIIEDVKESLPSGKIIYYIPHQGVYKSDSATTKLRIVFDASSHCKGAPSLNDCIHQGPTMLPDLCGTLIRARLTPFLITADVEKAFHQIRLQEDQRDATRFLWLKDPARPPTRDNIRILRFTRIPFGVNASPYLLSMSIKYALERDEHNQLREEILANTYVDNVLIGANNVEEYRTKQRLCKETFSRMHMNLRQFMSNSDEVMNNASWDPKADTVGVTAKTSSKNVTTKRTALVAFASTFDPLGLLTPLLVKAKIFIQDLWQKNYTWDEPLDGETLREWNIITREITRFTAQVPRFIGNTSKGSYDLVVFSDASQRIFAAVAYLVCRPKYGRTFSNLIFAKSKLAPLKKTTIPRLELLAAGLAVKLVLFLTKELNIHLNSIQLLSDSQIALYWIHSKKPLKPFANNRVKNINDALQKLTAEKIPSRFYYVNTEDNPAVRQEVSPLPKSEATFGGTDRNSYLTRHQNGLTQKWTSHQHHLPKQRKRSSE
ncbi:Pao retrotransposon peptidase [Ancylostoma duodenale]|uniref:Pao retrotransposon peptidase n=1 Tax=Ancylostoma duodenale TaxID=51022 RepID=A0A0C2CCD6_9BILA|nr:Pao retrotransposon peptidase [Ancylostoma duodenale]